MTRLNKKTKRLWVAWESQRRSFELSKKLGCDTRILVEEGRARYFKLIYRTLKLLYREKPSILFVQNPSMILALVACCYRFISGTPVVVDRHTTFMLNRIYRNTPRILFFKFCHYFTLYTANLTVVTNDFLASLVEKTGGRAVVLPDPVPEFQDYSQKELSEQFNVFLISSFGADEPIEEVLAAMRHKDMQDVHLYISGNHKKLDRRILDQSSDNVTFTGFLSDQEFINMLYSTDAVMVLTTADYTMLCGCYEAIAAEKPLITSDVSVLRNYFTLSEFVDNSSDSIREKILAVSSALPEYIAQTVKMKSNISEKWHKLFLLLETRLKGL